MDMDIREIQNTQSFLVILIFPKPPICSPPHFKQQQHIPICRLNLANNQLKASIIRKVACFPSFLYKFVMWQAKRASHP